MRKIDNLFNEHSQFSMLNKNVQFHQHLQQFWSSACPSIISAQSFAGSLVNGQLSIYAHSAAVATKIKLSMSGLLSQLQNLQRTNPHFRECKVTAIVVKVQVKSQPKSPAKAIRKPSEHGADKLKKLALNLGESDLSAKLNSIAKNISR